MLNYNINTYLKIIFLISLISLISAFFIEYILGHQPCNLCLIQRIPYGLSIILIIINYFSRKEEKFIIEENILPTEHWHPEERNASKLINTLNGEIVNVISTQIDEQTWYFEGDLKYEITYDKELKWTGLKFNADEDDIIEYICKNCK